MRLSQYHAAHGLTVTIASKQTGERIHLQFDKNQRRIPCIFDAGGHHAECAFELLPKEAHGGEFDLELRLVVATHPGSSLAPPTRQDGAPGGEMRTDVDIPPQLVHKVKNTRMAIAEDGAPMLPEEPAVAATVVENVENDPVYHVFGKINTIPDPRSIVVEGESTRSIVAGTADRQDRLAGVTPTATQRVRLPHEVHVQDHDEAHGVDPFSEDHADAAKEFQELMAASRALTEAPAPAAPVETAAPVEVNKEAKGAAKKSRR